MSLQVELVSPERIVWSGEAEMVIARTVGGGDIAFMDGHAPFVGALEIATATLVSGGEERLVALHGGFVEVTTEAVGATSDREAADSGGGIAGTRTIVTVLSDVAELGDEIDVARAQQAKETAAEQVRRSDQEVDSHAEAALRRAHVRLAAADAL